MIKILIPTDFSVQAEYAYLMVKKLAEKVDVDVHFLHVLNVPDTVTLSDNGVVETCGEADINYIETQKSIAERKLQQLTLLYGSSIQTKLLFGKLTDAVIQYAEVNGFDLITMGTKGAWGLKEKISGSETQMVARKSNVPVLSLMCDRSDLVIKNILLVHNYREQHAQNMQLLHKLIKAFEVKVHLLQISTSASQDDLKVIENDMKIFAANNELNNYEMHIISDRDVENGVVHFNQMNNMDIICMGTHAKGGLFHSSATEKLINHLYKPIISFHLKNK